MDESTFKLGEWIDEECQMEESRRYIRGRDTMGKNGHRIRKSTGGKNGLDNLSRKDESTGVRYLNTRGPGCTEGTCSGWLV